MILVNVSIVSAFLCSHKLIFYRRKAIKITVKREIADGLRLGMRVV